MSFLGCLLPYHGYAATQVVSPALDTGDTAWMLMSAALVLLMTVPGIALFYAGMVRKKNVLATMMQSFSICCLMSVMWMVIGYSLVFTTGSPFIGGVSKIMLNGILDSYHYGIDKGFVLGADTASPVIMTIPQSVYVVFQMTFIIISVAILAGSVAERIKFSALCVFCIFWGLLSYVPIAHWVWTSTGWLAELGAIDFAGGTVVHINAGVAGLVCALVVGKRIGYGKRDLSPFNVGYAVMGASLLWFGWFGFNAGSALGANGRAGMAMLVTQIAAASGGIGWMSIEWLMRKKPTVLGTVSGAVAGLVVITPAAGFVMPGPALVMGFIGGVSCFWSCSYLKRKLGYDDSLDAFGVHGVGGIIGAILTGVFAFGPLSATETDPAGISASFGLVVAQIEAVVVTILWSGIVSLVLLKIIDATIGLRVDQDSEREGLDMVLHNEQINT
ncbi:ammonium transporter [Commensalibacter oyaizuii]|uniref:Ammonium transporter n=1 Tax=Commensalibacter oyaizuii TaxID=3043873 RepID=A0ABT6Q3V7_9PROT|nr:ammonium transporter [Commensalibacter sp. TBRC 16381]MDI2091653.1 ammonium transporter [Commensalibacter sp. TBRC 16381]